MILIIGVFINNTLYKFYLPKLYHNILILSGYVAVYININPLFLKGLLDTYIFYVKNIDIFMSYYKLLSMPPTIKTLNQLGLSEKQARVYIAMLELGEAPMTLIAKKAGLKRPTTYLIVDELNVLGLSSEIVKGKKKYYSAMHPRRLVELSRFRSKQAEELLPELVAIQKIAEKPVVRMLEGIEGARIAYQEAYSLLNNKIEGLWMGNITFIIENFPELLREYDSLIQKITDPRIRELITGNNKSKNWVNEMQSKISKNHYVKYYKDSNNFGMTDQLIIGNTIIQFSFGTQIFVIITESKEIAQTQRALFELIWDMT